MTMILQFFGTLLGLLITPEGWFVIGEIFGELVGFYRAVLFLEVYAYCWPILRMAALPPQIRLLAKWLLRLQIVLVAGVVALCIGLGMSDAGWETQRAVAVAVSVFPLLPLLQEVLIRKLAVKREAHEPPCSPNAKTLAWWQRVLDWVGVVGLEAKAAVAALQERNWLGIWRVARVTGVSFGFTCLAFLPLMAALSAALSDGTDSGFHGVNSDAASYWFAGLIVVSFVVGVVFDAWFVRKWRKWTRAGQRG